MVKGFDSERFLAAFNVVQECVGFTAIADLAQRSQILETVDSTNQIAWERMTQDEEIEPVVIALSQRAGRGQWGRQWQSAPGGLYLSVGIKVELSVTQAVQLTLCTAWGIANALRDVPARLSGVEQGIPVQIKWLNDLVLQGRKLGGILTETRVQQETISRAVIGVGVNWANPVPATGINLQSFLENHPVPLIESLEMLAAIVLQGLFGGVKQQQQGDIEQILEEYLALLAHRDRPILLDDKAWTIVGITPTGELRVQPKLPEALDTSQVSANFWGEVLLRPGTINLGYPI